MTPQALQAYNEDEAVRYKESIRASIERNEWLKKKLCEDEQGMLEKERELRPDFRKHPMQFSEVVKRAFAKDIIKFIAP